MPLHATIDNCQKAVYYDFTLEMTTLSTISPKFTEKTVLEILLKLHPNSELTSYTVTPCGTRGTSYQSELFRLQIQAKLLDQKVTINAFVKALPRNLARRLTFRSPDFYAQEIEFLDKIWPAFVKLQQSHNVAEVYNEVPR